MHINPPSLPRSSQFWACMAHFFCQAEGENNDGICENTKKHILHKNEIVPSALAEAQNLESIKMRRTSMGGGIGGMKKDEQIRAAAELYARAGDLEKYCNIMFDDLGEHERALAVAPGVSMQFWQEVRWHSFAGNIDAQPVVACLIT